MEFRDASNAQLACFVSALQVRDLEPRCTRMHRCNPRYWTVRSTVILASRLRLAQIPRTYEHMAMYWALKKCQTFRHSAVRDGKWLRCTLDRNRSPVMGLRMLPVDLDRAHLASIYDSTQESYRERHTVYVYVKVMIRHRKQASKPKEIFKSHPARRKRNHGIISFLMFINVHKVRTNRFLVAKQKRFENDRESRHHIHTRKDERKGSLSPTKPPLHPSSDPSENSTTLLLLLELDGDSCRSCD